LLRSLRFGRGSAPTGTRSEAVRISVGSSEKTNKEESGLEKEREKLRTEAPVNGGRNYNGPKVAKFLVGQVKCEPVPAYIGGARTATCGRARVVPREVVSL